MSTNGKLLQHGKPQRRGAKPQPDAREGQAGPRGVADGLVVPGKPGNSGGGKGPEFKEVAAGEKDKGEWRKPTNIPIETFKIRRRRPTRRDPAIEACASLSESRMREIRTSWFDERGVETGLRATAPLLDST